MNWLLLNADGSQAIEFTSMFRFAIDNRSDVVSAPIEEGSFATYNKVESPLNIRASLAIQGTADDYNLALTAIEEFQKNLTLVALETPEAYYDSLNVVAYSYYRSADTGPLVVDLDLVEIIEVDTEISTTNYTRPSVKNAGSSSTVETGRSSAEDLDDLSNIKSYKLRAKIRSGEVPLNPE